MYVQKNNPYPVTSCGRRRTFMQDGGSPLKKGMEGDFETGNVRYKVRERFSFGFTDWRGVFGSEGAA